MVDALRRAHRIVRPHGWVIDIHPSTMKPSVEIGDEIVGYVDAPDAPARHAAATDAVTRAVTEGLFAIDYRSEFTFFTYGDSADELRDYISENWRNARIDATIAAQGRTKVRERVHLTKLQPRAYNSRQ